MTNLVFHEDAFSSTLYSSLFSPYVSITPRLFMDCLSPEGPDSGREGRQCPPDGRDLSTDSAQNSHVTHGSSFSPCESQFL